MIKAIIYRQSIRDCELRHRKLGLSRKECIFLYGQLFCEHFREKVQGRWKQVMVDKTIRLDGLTEKDFEKLYKM